MLGVTVSHLPIDAAGLDAVTNVGTWEIISSSSILILVQNRTSKGLGLRV
jgi:hypothetical protein